MGSGYSSTGLGTFGGRGGEASHSNEVGDLKLISESSKETLAEVLGFIDGCSGSDESRSTELLSADSFHVHGDVPRHSEAVW
jgi:hypothetical protein